MIYPLFKLNVFDTSGPWPACYQLIYACMWQTCFVNIFIHKSGWWLHQTTVCFLADTWWFLFLPLHPPLLWYHYNLLWLAAYGNQLTFCRAFVVKEIILDYFEVPWLFWRIGMNISLCIMVQIMALFPNSLWRLH